MLGDRIELEEVIRHCDRETGGAREMFANRVEGGAELAKRRNCRIWLWVRWNTAGAPQRVNHRIDPLLPGMADTPHPAFNIDLIVQIDTGLAVPLPGDSSARTQMAARQFYH